MLDFNTKLAINHIEELFKRCGMELYRINPQSLFSWNRIYTAFDKAEIQNRTQSRSALKLTDVIYSDDLAEGNGVPEAIVKTEGYLNARIYEIIVHEPDIFEQWMLVKGTLEDWLKAKNRKTE